ncbi:MAG: nucleoside triphosphate pyrophosphohydrolase [Vicingaceae bacterium]
MANQDHSKAALEFKRLLEIMDRLREECPWDRKQTNQTLRTLSIEETFELSEAILSNDDQEIKKELGDLLLHIAFYSKIGSEKGSFDMADVIGSICEKLIHRHPHIYGDVVVKDENEVKRNWEKLKLKEKGRTSVLDGVPKGLTGLLKAYRLQEKAAGVGFDWEKPEDVWNKVNEELHEWKEAIDQGDSAKMEEELGDLIFAMVNYTRFIDLNPEDALERSNRKFIKRFQYIEEQAAKQGQGIGDMTIDEMEVHYRQAKKKGL